MNARDRSPSYTPLTRCPTIAAAAGGRHGRARRRLARFLDGAGKITHLAVIASFSRQAARSPIQIMGPRNFPYQKPYRRGRPSGIETVTPSREVRASSSCDRECVGAAGGAPACFLDGVNVANLGKHNVFRRVPDSPEAGRRRLMVQAMRRPSRTTPMCAFRPIRVGSGAR